MEFIDSRSNLLQHVCRSYLFDNVEVKSFLIYDGLAPYPFVFDESGKLIHKTLDEMLFWQPSCIWRSCPSGDFNAEARLRLDRIESIVTSEDTDSRSVDKSIKGTAIYLTHPFGSYAYGHLHDTLQRLYSLSIDGHINWADYTYLVSDYRLISDFYLHLSTLTESQLDPSQILEVNHNTVYKCEKLLLGLPASYETQFTTKSYRWAIERYRRYFMCEPLRDDRDQYKLYLSRNHVVPGSRGVLNENEILSILSQKGYTILNGKEPLFQIVHYFSNAKIVIGPHGSLFSNTMFCRRHTQIIEFCPKTRVDRSFLLKTKEADDYAQILLDSDENHNLVIHPESIP